MRRKGWSFRLAQLAGALLSVTLVATACGGGATGGGTDGGGSGDKSLTVGYIPWDEDIAVTYLWKDILEQQGYTVRLKQLEVGPLFQGVARGDLDLFFDVWLPTTHGSYWDQYGDQVERIQQWYDNASLEWTVPNYVNVDSIADLKGKASMFNGEIIGIEAGAGLTEASKEEVIPRYGLGGEYTLKTSSTPAMLTALQRAVDAKEPIVVTLWHPHWAYNEYPIKDLEDPKGALGEAEQLYVIGKEGFSDENPQVTKWLKNFKLNDKQLSSLENLVIQKYQDNPAKGVDAWLKKNPDFVKSLGISS